MNYRKKRKISNVLIAVMVVFMLMFTGCSDIPGEIGNDNDITTTTPTTSVSGKGTLKVHYIDVGQADSILVQQDSEFMLIDAGNNDDNKVVKSYLEEQGVNSLKYFVGTHAHEDHIGAADDVINSFKVDKVYFPKQTATTKTYRDFVAAVKNKGLKLTVPKPGDSFKLGDADITVLAPNSPSYEDANDYSIVLKVAYGDTSFLLTGDAESLSEKEMISSGRDLSATVLKIGHHGSTSSTSQAFLDKVKPKYAVISAGRDNDYNHPSTSVMNRLKSNKIPVYRTDESGTVVATSDGKDVSFDVNQGSYGGMIKGDKITTSNPTEAQKASFKASVNNARPEQYTDVELNVSGPSASYKAICHFKSKDTIYSGRVGTPKQIHVSGAAKGYKVVIDVEIEYNGKTYKTQTSFTPR